MASKQKLGFHHPVLMHILKYHMKSKRWKQLISNKNPLILLQQTQNSNIRETMRTRYISKGNDFLANNILKRYLKQPKSVYSKWKSWVNSVCTVVHRVHAPKQNKIIKNDGGRSSFDVRAPPSHQMFWSL